MDLHFISLRLHICAPPSTALLWIGLHLFVRLSDALILQFIVIYFSSILVQRDFASNPREIAYIGMLAIFSEEAEHELS